MAENNKSVSTDTEVEVVETKVKKADKKAANVKPNIFVRLWRKLCKLCKDVVGEMKKVVWTPKDELSKSTKLVLVTVVAVALCIAVVDTFFSWAINSIAGMIG